MKWLNSDLKKFVEAKEYVDTVIIPVRTFQLSDETTFEKDSFNRELLSIYANEIEKDLSGRILLSPTYTYVKTSDIEKEVERINEWIKNILTQPFKHIFILTLDTNWKKVEQQLEGNLLWILGMKPVDLQATESVNIIRNQVEQITDLIRSYW